MICGYLHITSQWYATDAVGSQKTFTLYCSPDGKIQFDPLLRQHWEESIKPKYRRRGGQRFGTGNAQGGCLFDEFDVKSNPRRDHAFCQAYHDFLFEAIPLFLSTGGSQTRPVPFLILAKNQKSAIDGTIFILRIQKIVRGWMARQRVQSMRLDPEILFSTHLSEALRELRLQKAGVHLTTYRTMRASCKSV